MGVRLVVEVLDHVPPELGRPERLVLIAIAEKARDATRLAQCGRQFLLRRTGLGPRGLRYVFERLAERGLEVRVPIGIDKLGRPLYAVPGVQSTYRVPLFAHAKGETNDPLKGELQVRQADVQTRQADMAVRQADADIPPVPQPSVPQQQAARARGARPPAHIQMIMDRTGATADEALAVADLVAVEKTPKDVARFVRHLAQEDELDVWLDRVRAERARLSHADFRRWLGTQPECDHGVPGGHIADPGSGWVACPIERRRLRAAGGRR